MKLTCRKAELQKALTLAERSSSKNPTLPILSAILIKTSKNKLFINSTNLEVGFWASISCKTDKEGEAAVGSKILLSTISSITDDDITLDSSTNTLKIISKSSSSNLKCFPSEDFPILPTIKKENLFKIESGSLVEALKNTIPATALSYNKPELSSVYFFSQNKQPLTLTATDSFRLAEYKTNANLKPFSFLLPQKSAQEAIRIFEDYDGEIEVAFNKNQASFSSEDLFFITQLTEGKFPDYQAIIPKSFSTQVVADKNHVINSVRAAGVFSSRLSEVLLSTAPTESSLEVRSSHSDTGEHQSLCPAKVSGDPVEASFNFHYILDALHSISSPNIFMGFNGAGKAILIRGFEDGRYLHLIMPMRGM